MYLVPGRRVPYSYATVKGANAIITYVKISEKQYCKQIKVMLLLTSNVVQREFGSTEPFN